MLVVSLLKRHLRQSAQNLAFQVRPWVRGIFGDWARRIFSCLLAGPEPGRIRERAHATLWDGQGPLISVVVPCFNYGRYVTQAVRSVRRQTLQDFELIVVDDGSDDPCTLRVLRRLQRWAQLQVVRQGNAGSGAARNAGIAVAQGRYICCLDADDLLAPDYLEKCAIVLEGDVGVRLVHSWMQLFGTEHRLARTLDLKVDLLRFVNHLGASAVFYREDWCNVNGYSTLREQHEDWDFWIRLASIGVFGRVIAEPLFFYRRHSAGRVGTVNSRGLQAYKELRREHPGFFSCTDTRRRLKEGYRQRIVVDPFVNLATPGQYFSTVCVLCLHLRRPDDVQRCSDQLMALLCRSPGLSLQVVVEHDEALPDWLQQMAEVTYRLPVLLDRTQWGAFFENFRRTRDVVVMLPEPGP
jgi:glycosyltransferase involved in cell wall biosynthesis